MRLQIHDRLLPVFFSRSRKKQQKIEIYINTILAQIADKIISDKSFSISLDDKIALSQWIAQKAIEKYGQKHVVIAWTGGKDSTLILWMLRQALKKTKIPMPDVMFINEGHVFDEVRDFVKKITKDWNLSVTEVQNKDVLYQAKKIGDRVEVKKLDKENRQEVQRLGYTKDSFPFEPESYVGNHLMKTVAMNRYLKKTKYRAVITGIRWDEQEARSGETYFSQRGDKYTPEHMRIHPILHFSERDIWDAILTHKIPYCILYKQGYRSLGAKGTTHKADSKPAWEQDFDKISERAGRRQDKEGIMKTLRKLGYM